MDNIEAKISVCDVREEVALLVKENVVATYVDEETALQVHFLNGQKFRISVEEM